SDYSFLLGLTYFRGDEQMDATIIDQVKYGYFEKDWSLYAWGGGFLDPILRSIEGNEEKIYLLGLSYAINKYVFSYTHGLPDGQFNVQPKAGLTFGYRIELEDIEF
ncbi:MAG: hypothetical protein ABIH39_02230, partial [Candidatus Margulisiibacteriota bacterium]